MRAGKRLLLFLIPLKGAYIDRIDCAICSPPRVRAVNLRLPELSRWISMPPTETAMMRRDERA